MNKLSKVSLASAGLISAGLIFANIALAVGPSSSPGSQGATRSAAARQRLDQAKLKVCQVREDALKRRSERLIQLVDNMEDKFTSIAQRVKDFYTSKVVPAGKTVGSYDSLVSDIDTKKAAVQEALTHTQESVASFSCGGDDPKGVMMDFRKDMQAVKGALKDYRTAIKDLIVAVHTVKGSTPSARPTRSPNQGGNRP